MSQQRRILAAVDGSEWTDRIVDYLCAVFPAEGTEVVLFHVANPLPEILWDFQQNPLARYRMHQVRAYLEAYRERVEKKLEENRQKLVNSGFSGDLVKVRTEIRQVGVARDIIFEAQKGYDVLVMGRRGESRLKDLILGSIVTKVIGRLSMVPVAVVGFGPPEKGVVIAVDGSPETTRIAHCVGRIFQNSDHDVQVVHILRGMGQAVVPPITDMSLSALPPEWFDWVEQERETARRQIERIMEDVVEILASYGLRSSQTVVTDVASRAEEIVNQARMRKYGTIVVGRRGISKVEEFLLGRVSNKVLQLARQEAVWVVSCA
ncbi:universal stress protein [Thermodesulforhabdus norvegica]|uniref:Nucleotide-binding universal stress protein, UspA family n=1 Tax=Thermodesulforhabdus norvegica TaxID=39841 RepID=A0A1I4SIN9_9BACT|nr:universal stress protein [Thermodesulforhabdus norvegica]SFM64180.1 Nucleotide-binding universal stress protein, UspA family [Thermodesulforhabdus norvegica]